MPVSSTTRRGVLALGCSIALAGCSALFGPEFPDDPVRPPDSHIEVIRPFVERVHDGEYEAAREPFNQELRDALSAEEIEDVWAEETGHLGTYDGIEQWAYEPDGPDEEEMEGVYVRVGMTEGHYDLQTTLDPDLRMAGVFIIDVVED